MSAVVGATEDDEDAEGGDANPFDGARIEVDERELQATTVVHRTAGRLKARLNELATRLTYGRP